MIPAIVRVTASLVFFSSCHASQIPLISHQVPAILQVPQYAWTEFNLSIDGQLYSGLPIALPCFDNFNGVNRTVDQPDCDFVKKNNNSQLFFAEQMTGYTQGNWAMCQISGAGCPISPAPFNATFNESAPCDQGNLPSFFVNVTSVQDVQQALSFATKWNLPVVVKNSGHDYKGRSAGAYSLALWVRNYAPDLVLNRTFTPDGCTESVGDVITMGTGQEFDGAYEFASENDATIVGGSASTVSPAGGWISGGGHSALSPVYGLGVDNVQQLRVVLPNGTYVTANRCQNQDIFFALRGGGGGTFGVTMEMSYRALPRFPVQWANVTFVNLTQDQQGGLLSVLIKNANNWFDRGWGGYAFPAGNRTAFTVQLVNPLNHPDALDDLQDLIHFADLLCTPKYCAKVELTTYPDFYALYAANIRTSYADELGGYGLAQTSRLIPRENFDGQDNQTKLVQALMTAVNQTTFASLNLMLLLTTPARNITDSDSAITPAWRRSTWHVINAAAWDPANFTTANVTDTFKMVTNSFKTIRDMTPDGGAYLNEGDTFEPDPVDTYWGPENYQRLSQIKSELDPYGILRVHQGIGSTSSDPRFSCYPSMN